MPFEFDSVLSGAATTTATRFSGHPPFHFVGGNIDEPTVPVEGRANAVGKVFRSRGHELAKYGMGSGPQGHLALREFVCDCLKRRNEMSITPDEVLLTSGSLQAMDLVNKALLSVNKMVAAGNRVVFDSGGSYIEHKQSKEKLWMTERGGMYMLRLWVKTGF